MLQKFFKIIRGLFHSTTKVTVAVVAQKQQETAPIIATKPEEVREISWFTRANNLVEEFAYEPNIIHSSNFSQELLEELLQDDVSLILNQAKPVKEGQSSTVTFKLPAKDDTQSTT